MCENLFKFLDLVTSGMAQIYDNQMHADYRALLYSTNEDSVYAVAKE